jgi:SAM-dependent methyltransferase
MKQRLIHGLRRLGLLGLADAGVFLAYRVLAWPANRRFRAAHPDFPVPPAPLYYDVFNDVCWETYRRTGREHAELFLNWLQDQGVPTHDGPAAILEWGCGPGRIVRHLATLLGPEVRLCGSDYNAASIAWCREHLPGVRFELNGLEPPTVFPDQSFDAIYCFSVFTHLSESCQLRWAQELHRLLKPGGVLIATTHGPTYEHLLLGPERDRFAAGDVVVQGGVREGKKWFFAIHPPEFVQGRLFADFATVQLLPPATERVAPQDVWVARRSEHG